MLIEYLNHQHEVKVISYGESSYILCEIESKQYEYILLGADIPVPDDNTWRFWIEYGFKDGHTEIEKWDMSNTQEEMLKEEIRKFIKENNKK